MPRPDNENNLAVPCRLTDRMVAILESDALKTITETVGDVTYIGKAACGSSTARPVWQITRITAAGAVVTQEWAEGNGKFEHIFDHKDTITYL